MAEKEEKNESKSEEIIETALKRFDLAIDQQAKIRDKALDDLKFRLGEQWPDDIKNQRDLDNRPCLTINKIPQFTRQVTNDQRKNRPSIIVNPVDDKADVDTAKIYQGLIRNIENSSDAEMAYDRAFEGAVNGSFGYFRIITDYISEDSFELEPKIEMIDNPFNVLLDPYFTKPDGSDANFGFIFEDVPKDDFIAEYGESKLAADSDWESLGSSVPGWASKDSCRVAEYYYKEFEYVNLYQLNDGKIYYEKDLPEDWEEIGVLDKRKTKLCKVKHVKMTAVDILEESEFPSKYIPIIPVLGDRMNIDGEIHIESLIRHAKDPQQMYNYWASAETESITLAPKAPYLATPEQIEGYEEMWETANIKNYSYLPYNAVTEAGQPLGAPQRNSIEPAVMAITQARMMSQDDLKSTLGMYDASLGNRSNESSGVAIQRRASQAQTTNYHFIDNLGYSIRHCGRILVDMIPKVYDTERSVRILGIDDEPEIVKVNSILSNEKSYQLGAGKYDVVVDTGPNYATKRQEAVESMLSMASAYPAVAQVAGDIMVKNMDWPDSQTVAERLKKTIPPEVLQEEDEEQQIPPQIQAQMQQMNQMVEALTEELKASQQIIDQKKMELDSKERIEMMKIEADLAKVQYEQEGKASLELLKAQINEVQQRLSQLTPTGGAMPGQTGMMLGQPGQIPE